MSRAYYQDADIDTRNTDTRNGSSQQRRSPYDINLPPQYRDDINDQYEEAAHFPDEEEIRRPFERLSNNQALRIVRHDFENAANYRYQNHDWRWTIADTLYTGWKQTKFWEGTKIARANVSVMVDFEQIESIMPRIMQGLFGSPKWFEAVGLGSTTPQAARKIRDIMVAQLQDSNPREVLRRVCKSGVKYGNGIMMVGWNYEVRKSLQFIPEFVPKTRQVRNPIDGTIMRLVSGGYNRRVVEKVVEDYINQPFMKYIPLRRFYVDPNCPSPVPSEGRFCAIETYMYVDELDAMRECAGFEDMPDLFTLLWLSKQNFVSQGDQSMSEQEAIRRSSWSPWEDQSTDPAAARIKVVQYFTRDRIIWTLNNRFLVYNKPNPIGRITIHDAFYADLLDRFYAMAISDVVEPEQRVQEGLLNSRLDELSLAVHPTTVRQKGSGTPIYQIRVRPGGVSESTDPKNDVIRQYPSNATANSHLEAQASQMRAQKSTGVTDFAVMGIGTSTNPAAKTATGAGVLGQAAASRIIYFVENVESCLVEPSLQDVFDYNQRFLDPDQMIEGVNGDGSDTSNLDPMDVFGAKVKFSMRASSKMQSRAALLQLMPMTLQAMLNPQLLVQLQLMGKTIDFVEMMNMFTDASGYREKFNWVRDLTQEEKAAMSEKQPNQAEIDMMLQTSRLNQMKDLQTSKQEMEILKDMLNTLLEAKLAPILNRGKDKGKSGSTPTGGERTEGDDNA